MSASPTRKPADEESQPAQERTPLLSASVGRPVHFRRPFGGAPDPTAGSLPAHLGQRHRPSFIARTEDVSIDELQYDLARTGSVGSFSGWGNPYQSLSGTVTPNYRRSASNAFSDIVSDTEDALSEVTEDEGDGGERDRLVVPRLTKTGPSETSSVAAAAEEEVESEQSKFIDITTARFYLLFTVIMLTYFVACFDSTLMASAHPVITSYFDASEAASWLSTVFLITSTAFQPLFGRLSDTFGRRWVYVFSLFVFGVTTAWCALANDIGTFIAARAFCGFGAGGAMSLSLIILSDTVRIADRGVYQSHINLAFGLGSASGATFGGFLCDVLNWRWAFGVQVPLILLGALMAIFFTPARLGPMFIEDSKGEDGGPWTALKKFDFLGSALLTITVTALILFLNLGGNIYPWVSAPVIACLVVFLVFCPAFVWAEGRAYQPLMPIRLLTRAPVANLIFSNTIGLIATNTILFNAPLFFQAVQLKSASDSGLRLGIPTFIGSLAGISTGYIITYTKQLKPTLTLGTLAYLAGTIAVMFINKGTSEILSLIFITGVPLGQGWVLPTSILAVLAVSEQADQAIVTTTLGLWRNLGTVLGIALSSLIFQNALKLNLEQMVTVPNKVKVIEKAKRSVRAIGTLHGLAQTQVIDAYAASLRITFALAVVSTVILALLLLPLKLPRLTKAKISVNAEPSH